MGIWIFMLVMVLFIPLTMIVFGRRFLFKAPQQINALFGYRSAMSMKNQDTWIFAHRYCGKIWYYGGWILLPIAVIVMLLTLGRDTDVITAAGTVLTLIETVVLAGAILPTEIALRKTFDQDGRRL